MKSLIALSLIIFSNLAAADLILYTDRTADRFIPAAKLFQQQTGEQVIFIEGSYKDLVQRLEFEKDSPQADLIVTKDIVYLADLVSKNLLQPMQETAAVKTVAPFMREKDGKWVAFTYRARTAVYSTALNRNELTTYENLAESTWQGRLCLRTGTAAYNEALVSYLIADLGEARAKQVVSGWVNNLAAPVFKDDVAVIKAIAQGTCDVGIVNHYYFAGEMSKPENANLPVKIAFLDQNGKGVHTNGTAIGIIATSPKAALAQKFIDLLLSKEIQLQVSAAHFDYPAVTGLVPTTLIKDWEQHKLSPVSWSDVGNNVEKARAVISEAGYN